MKQRPLARVLVCCCRSPVERYAGVQAFVFPEEYQCEDCGLYQQRPEGIL